MATHNLNWSPNQSLPDVFFDIAKSVYATNAFWIAESETQIRQQFSESNTYFDHAKAQVFIADNCARLVGFFNPENVIEGEPVAYFGFWETHDNFDVNEQLFAEFETWAKQQGA